MRIIEEPELQLVKEGKIPRHVGCIMDGNGRWARMRGKPRSAGHEEAELAVYSTVDSALDMGIAWLTVYAFSTENWKRDPEEVSFLMSFDRWLLKQARRDELHEKGVRILFAGDLKDPRIPDASRQWLYDCMEQTAQNDRMNFTIAFNYGGRTEILEAFKTALSSGVEEPVDERSLTRLLYVPDMPDMDLLIRTSAEVRTSNFFPWHATYAEYVFTDTLWPDFRGWHLVSAVAEYQQRRRRKGASLAQ